MYLVIRQQLKTVCVCLTWIQLILSIIKDGINFDKTDIARNLTLFLYPDDSDRQGELPVSSNNTSWFQTVRN